MPTRKETLQIKIDTNLASGTSITAIEHRDVESSIMNASIAINRGWFTGFDVGGAGTLVVSGDVVSAISTIPTTDTKVTVTFATSMIDTNYFIKIYVQSMGDGNLDNEIYCPVFKILSATTAEIWFKEIGGLIQNLKVHLEAFSLNY